MSEELRLCTEGDLAVLQQVARQTYEDTFGPMNAPATMEAYLDDAFRSEQLLAELRDPHCRFYFLLVDDDLAGYLKVNEAPSQSDLNDPESLEVERIYVRAQHKRKGFGKSLINHAVQLATESEKRYVWLGVWERNSAAVEFYRRAGFREVGTHLFRMGDELQRDLIMRKDLR